MKPVRKAVQIPLATWRLAKQLALDTDRTVGEIFQEAMIVYANQYAGAQAHDPAPVDRHED